ncbi:hypothetical protein [Pelagibius sp. Alg239-R121]|uniref:hypothetical protein n=1 Tax=Pelagibius sp. Alg239-R121 TaxID=2993448 RepID=UPI0024A783E8|nr:hypothetical protein [Pelagibius sp. Alg239-R121]
MQDNGIEETTEIVGRFAERENFKAAVETLLAAGFRSSDLSVLDTHEALSASESTGAAWQQAMIGLVGEIKYVGPITAAGLIAVATGPVGAAMAGLVAAGLTSVALSELLTTLRATPHTEQFARALESGTVLLWVRTISEQQSDVAAEILTRHGAEDVHSHRRSPQI